MSRLSPQAVDDLKARAIISDYAAQNGCLLKGQATKSGNCPCSPNERGKSYFSVHKDFWKCHKCEKGGDIIKFLEEFEGLDFRAAVERLGGVAQDPHHVYKNLKSPEQSLEEEAALREKKRLKAEGLWRDSEPAEGSPVELYLQGRGIMLPIPPDIRYLAKAKYWHNSEVIHTGAAMIAKIKGLNGAGVGVHLTWIDVSNPGKKQTLFYEGEPLKAKKMEGLAGGGAVYLTPPASTLIIGEGIETAFSAYQVLQRPDISVVSGLSLGNIGGGGLGVNPPHPTKPNRSIPNIAFDPARPGFLPPVGTKHVMLLGDGDSDPHFTRAMLTRATLRYQALGLTVRVIFAEEGKDFNDMLNEGGRVS